MSDTESPPAGKGATKKFRSPPFPFIALPKAVERVKQLHAKVLHHPANMAVLADAWGYAAKSSGLAQTAGALIQFGLMTDEGAGKARKFRITNDALRIIQDADPESPRRREALRRVALGPATHKELWDQFGVADIADSLLVNALTLDRLEAGQAPFSPSTAQDLIDEYRTTIAFAGLTKADTVSDGVEDENDEEVENSSNSPADEGNDPVRNGAKGGRSKKGRTLKEGERVLQDGILSRDTSYYIVVNGPLGPREIDRLIKKLEFDRDFLADDISDERNDADDN